MADNSLITKAQLRQTVTIVDAEIKEHNESTEAHPDIRNTLEQKSQVQIITWEADD